MGKLTQCQLHNHEGFTEINIFVPLLGHEGDKSILQVEADHLPSELDCATERSHLS
ncbi:MAG: hypothetical protein ACYTXI_42700 [Nostoc sp.]